MFYFAHMIESRQLLSWEMLQQEPLQLLMAYDQPVRLQAANQTAYRVLAGRPGFYAGVKSRCSGRIRPVFCGQGHGLLATPTGREPNAFGAIASLSQSESGHRVAEPFRSAMSP
jgi:hypothetical protein